MRSTTRISRTSISLLLVFAFVLVFAVGAGSAYAACSEPFNCFAGDDGDQASGPNGLTDWQDIAGSVIPADDPAKGSDTKFSGGDKEIEPGSWDFIKGNNTPKTDILKGWSRFDGQFLYVAFSRAKQNGDTFLSFELNQLGAGPRTSGGIPVPHRSTGDILFTYDISTTDKLSFGMCTWEGDENAGVWKRLDGTVVGGSVKQCSTLNKQTTPAAEGNVNWNDAIDPNFLTDFKPIGAGQFGEAVVDLGALGTRFLTDACGPNGWFWMHSRASQSVLSQPKDLLAGNPIASPTCGLAIDKKVSLSGADGTFVDSNAGSPLAATVGDTVHYSITVTNTGTADLTVDVNDALCDPNTLTGPNGRDGDDDPLAAGASVEYRCTHVLQGSDADPLTNTACTTGTATLGNATTMLGQPPNTICDSTVVDIFQPGELAGATGTKFQDTDGSGSQGPGEGPLAGFVFYVDYNGNSVLDAGEPAGTSDGNGNWSIAGIKPGTYPVREVGRPGYTCTAPAAGCSFSVGFIGGQTATVGAFGNQPVTAQQVQNPNSVSPGSQEVLGTRIGPGRARLLAPTGCVARTFRARVRGVRIARVVFKLDGHRIKTLTRKNFRGTYAVRIDPRHLRLGVHRLVATVTFQRGSATKAKTYRLAFQRCPRALRAPRFTG
ncbi:MAG TPA: hypothetical protein VH247_04325 [Thermoleophilaceae bacterium]|nr:hypothetical protein [Thermoleophilaceae bacterium]